VRSIEKATLHDLKQREQYCSDSLWLIVVNFGAKEDNWNGVMYATHLGLNGY